MNNDFSVSKGKLNESTFKGEKYGKEDISIKKP